MNLKITEQRPATSKEWDDTWAACDYATYFQSREWAEIWNVYTKGWTRPEPVQFVFSDGKQALLPISFQKRAKGLIKQFLLSPEGTYGGWITQDNLAAGHERLLMDYLKNQCPNLIWRLNPYAGFKFSSELHEVREDETYVLDLSQGFEMIYSKWAADHKTITRNIRKAISSRVSVKPGLEKFEWKAYFNVYEDSLKRWGAHVSSRYGEKLFQEMHNRQSPHIKLWLAYFQEKVISGAVCFFSQKKMVGWHLVALEKYFSLYPVNFMVSEIIKNACENGCQWFDYNPSGGHEGVKNFKKSFGAVELSCPVLISKNKTARLAEKIKNAVYFHVKPCR